MRDAVEAHHVMVNRLHRSRAIRRPKAIRESDEIVVEVLIANGENIKYISSQLGHASVQITVDRYGHLFPDARRAAAGRFEERLASSKNPADQSETPANSTTSVETEWREVPRKTDD
jgi:hypothetical protein